MSRRQFLRFASCLFAALAPAVASGGIAVGEPQLPDLIAWASETNCHMYCGTVDPALVPGETVFRFRGALPNIGPGRLEVREVTHPNGVQDVYQRIYDDNDQLDHERLIGSFPGADSVPPRHLWLPGIAQYNLRAVLPENGVGDIVASQDKISMAVVDSAPYNKSLPGAPQSAVYNSVSASILGISIGWADVYGTGLPGQWIPVTHLASGQYWLEVVVDPYDQIEESDEANNVTQILVNLTIPAPTRLAGDYNTDGIVDAADYTVWRNTLGQNDIGDMGEDADGDASGTIRQADYDIWKAHYGDTMSGVGNGGLADVSPIAVPEPSATALLFVAFVTFVACRRRPPARTFAASRS
jgi:hypothetical protein